MGLLGFGISPPSIMADGVVTNKGTRKGDRLKRVLEKIKKVSLERSLENRPN